MALHTQMPISENLTEIKRNYYPLQRASIESMIFVFSNAMISKDMRRHICVIQCNNNYSAQDQHVCLILTLVHLETLMKLVVSLTHEVQLLHKQMKVV